MRPRRCYGGSCTRRWRGPAAEQLRAKLMRQIYDLGALMKLLKQRFSTWFNRSHRRFGTLWAARYSNTSVEGCPMDIRTVAASIDLNPVRAGLVDDPARLSGTACRERGTPACRVKPYQASRLREAVPGGGGHTPIRCRRPSRCRARRWAGPGRGGRTPDSGGGRKPRGKPSARRRNRLSCGEKPAKVTA